VRLLARSAFALGILALSTSVANPQAAWTSKAKQSAAVVEDLHVGQKVANYIRTFDIPGPYILVILSSLPVIELCGAVLVGIWMGLLLNVVLPACIPGNMVPP
jgi:hypothetical protein